MVGTGRFELPRLGSASHPRMLYSYAAALRLLCKLGRSRPGSPQANLPLQAEVSGGIFNGGDGRI
jgi:hypothetical protein